MSIRPARTSSTGLAAQLASRPDKTASPGRRPAVVGRRRSTIRRLAGSAAGLATAGGIVAGLPTTAHAATNIGASAVAIAASEAGKPYVYGGSGPSSFDCSGLVSYVYARLGVSLPHNAAAQYNSMAHVPQSQIQPGDIVFFYNASGIYHDGIYAGGGQMWVARHPGTAVQLETIWTSQYLVGQPWGAGAATVSPVPPTPTAQPASFEATGQPLLRDGATGPAVASVQRTLGITADGIFGPQTLGAVEHFQAAHGLVVDGIVGPQTWGALHTQTA